MLMGMGCYSPLKKREIIFPLRFDIIFEKKNYFMNGETYCFPMVLCTASLMPSKFLSIFSFILHPTFLTSTVLGLGMCLLAI